jgi:hypothetical protein
MVQNIGADMQLLTMQLQNLQRGNQVVVGDHIFGFDTRKLLPTAPQKFG